MHLIHTHALYLNPHISGALGNMLHVFKSRVESCFEKLVETGGGCYEWGWGPLHARYALCRFVSFNWHFVLVAFQGCIVCSRWGARLLLLGPRCDFHVQPFLDAHRELLTIWHQPFRTRGQFKIKVLYQLGGAHRRFLQATSLIVLIAALTRSLWSVLMGGQSVMTAEWEIPW